MNFHSDTVASSATNESGLKLSEYWAMEEIFISLIRPLKKEDCWSEFTPMRRLLNGPEKSKKLGASSDTISSYTLTPSRKTDNTSSEICTA